MRSNDACTPEKAIAMNGCHDYCWVLLRHSSGSQLTYSSTIRSPTSYPKGGKSTQHAFQVGQL